jgi:hypothetical protein
VESSSAKRDDRVTTDVAIESFGVTGCSALARPDTPKLAVWHSVKGQFQFTITGVREQLSNNSV